MFVCCGYSNWQIRVVDINIRVVFCPTCKNVLKICRQVSNLNAFQQWKRMGAYALPVKSPTGNNHKRLAQILAWLFKNILLYTFYLSLSIAYELMQTVRTVSFVSVLDKLRTHMPPAIIAKKEHDDKEQASVWICVRSVSWQTISIFIQLNSFSLDNLYFARLAKRLESNMFPQLAALRQATASVCSWLHRGAPRPLRLSRLRMLVSIISSTANDSINICMTRNRQDSLVIYGCPSFEKAGSSVIKMQELQPARPRAKLVWAWGQKVLRRGADWLLQLHRLLCLDAYVVLCIYIDSRLLELILPLRFISEVPYIPCRIRDENGEGFVSEAMHASYLKLTWGILSTLLHI